MDRGGRPASWGNAGWVSPVFAVPLPEPAVLRTGRTLLSASSPVRVSGLPNATLLRFTAGFLARCTHRRWAHALLAASAINRTALAAHDELAEAGTAGAVVHRDPFVVAFGESAGREGMLTELADVGDSGMPVHTELLTGEEVRDLEPSLAHSVGAGLLVHGQRSVDPPRFLELLRGVVASRGGVFVDEQDATALDSRAGGVQVVTSGGQRHRADVAVLAGGAWLTPLARRVGVRRPVQAGRGYSFRVPGEGMPVQPTYLPAQRVVCTPLSDGTVRVSGIMEFARPDAPFNARRVQTMVDTATSWLPGARWDQRTDEWVGSRPCTADGLPLVGRSADPRVFVHGGHGMWGLTQGPATAGLLAHQIATGTPPAELAALDPLR